MNQPVCRGYQCTSSRLINAHIIPRGFARDVKGQHPHNLKISLDKVRPTQLGVYDPGILCNDCDGKLGRGDKYALEVCRRFANEHKTTPDGLFEMYNVDGDQFATFVLSVLWRASITSRVECRSVSLGPYESEACEVIFGAKPLHAMTAYQLLLARYEGVGRFNPENSYTFPARRKIGGTNGWAFVPARPRIWHAKRESLLGLAGLGHRQWLRHDARGVGKATGGGHSTAELGQTATCQARRPATRRTGVAA